jgi:beta-glucanase (GH16 family)
MNKIRKIIFAIFIVSFACSDDKTEENTPKNLVIDVETATDGSGEVSVTATAENATFYTIYFGLTGEVPVVTNDGKAEHTYTESGNYTITVQAHSVPATFITTTENISVTIKTVIPSEGYTTPETYPGMTLLWQDEFNASAVNESDWTFEIGRGGNGWGNNELEYYKKENATIEDGKLVITAKKENVGDAQYTSTRMITKDKKTFKFGRIDIRALLPKGQGIWPALWMLGNNINSVGWPACGEIDIMEMIGGQNREKTVYGTLHWDNGGSHACTCDKPGHSLSSGIYADQFHVFSLDWTETSITFYVDDVQFNKIDITPVQLSEFKNEYFFIFNLAVGGNWPGNPDATTVFPQRLIVDYVRVFQKN